MIRCRRFFANTLVAAALVIVAPHAGAQAPAASAYADDPHAQAVVPGLAPVGKWMVGPDGRIAHWLGEIYDGKQLREPINIIILDERSRTPRQAIASVTAALAAAGYPVRFGHSTGYRALIGGSWVPQLPSGRDDAFSTGVYLTSNNHGRLFGPLPVGDGHLFTAAFSRELVRVTASPHHAYGSFNQARDDVAWKLDRASPFKVAGFVNLDNAIVGDPKVGTGDHDGIAIFLRSRR